MNQLETNFMNIKGDLFYWEEVFCRDSLFIQPVCGLRSRAKTLYRKEGFGQKGTGSNTGSIKTLGRDIFFEF